MSAGATLASTDFVEISGDAASIDLDHVHRFLCHESHWARGIDRATVERALGGSLCFAARRGGRQIGFARVVTDRATFAYVADVFVDAGERGRGVARRLVQAILAHPDVRNLRRVLLVSRDARGLYERTGFTALAHPERWMERHNANPYGGNA